MKKSRLIMSGALLVAAGLILSGCTSAGPYVTNISSDGNGNLVIEKNTVYFNAFTGTVSSGDHPVAYTIQVVPQDKK